MGNFSNRITTWAILKEKRNGKELVFFNTHLDNDGKIARKESARLIVQKIKEIAPHIPAILTGDFNCTPDETPLQVLEENGMKNSLKTANVTYGPSWSFHDFGRLTKEECTLLDYIFTTDNIEVNRYRVIQDEPNNGFLSDHYPILVKLAFK